jgi:chemosensory pili system protein ChpA (sensor histidine kinase/response regulator)
MVMSQSAEHSATDGAPATDLGPLAWVLDESRKSIESASRAIKRFAHDAEAARGVDLTSIDASTLRVARQQLHQVVGALEMVGQSVPAQMVRAMEGAAQRFVSHPEQCTESAAQTLERAGFALIEYLDAQLGERPRPALGLFPQFKQVQEMAGADRIHPADLSTVPWRWIDPVVPAAAHPLAYSPEVRGRLDQRVLKLMKHDDLNAASELSMISLGLAQHESARQPAIFWKLSAGFFEALGQALIPVDLYAKRAASRVLLQFASLARGDQGVSERLAHGSTGISAWRTTCCFSAARPRRRRRLMHPHWRACERPGRWTVNLPRATTSPPSACMTRRCWSRPGGGSNRSRKTGPCWPAVI